MTFTLEQLDSRVRERASASPDESYTARLVAKGVERCAQKLGEEAVEAAIAAVTGSTSNLPFLFKQLEALNAKDTAALSDMIQTWVDAH